LITGLRQQTGNTGADRGEGLLPAANQANRA